MSSHSEELKELVRFLGEENIEEVSKPSRYLDFRVILLGDQNLKYVKPGIFDYRRETYIRTFTEGRLEGIKNFILTTKFVNLRKFVLHAGAEDLNEDALSPDEVALRIKAIIFAIKSLAPGCEVYISLQFMWKDDSESEHKTKLLNRLIKQMACNDMKIFVIPQSDLVHSPPGMFENSKFVNQDHGTPMFVSEIKKVLRLH
ncbi:hypothetical protein ACOME3_006099 [Neoechinorhynchus agilis]